MMISFTHVGNWLFFTLLMSFQLIFKDSKRVCALLFLTRCLVRRQLHVRLQTNVFLPRYKCMLVRQKWCPIWFHQQRGEIDESTKANYERLKKLRPDVVFINVGGNDLTTASRGLQTKCPDSKMKKESFNLQRKKTTLFWQRS